MNKAAAWIMKLNSSLYASISQMELVHIVNNPVFVQVPKSPTFCEKIIIWNDNVLPVVDLNQLYDQPAPVEEHKVVAVIIFRDDNNDLHYGGIALKSSPMLEYVNNSQSCTIPAHATPLQDVTLACFTSEQGHQVPILNMTKIFSREYAKTLIDR
jgi:chemotaxis signal transduction protein